MSTRKAYYCSRPSKLRDDEFLTWASTEPLTGSHPTLEIAEPLWFEFDADENMAVYKVQAEVNILFPRSVIDWVRVPAK